MPSASVRVWRQVRCLRAALRKPCAGGADRRPRLPHNGLQDRDGRHGPSLSSGRDRRRRPRKIIPVEEPYCSSGSLYAQITVRSVSVRQSQAA